MRNELNGSVPSHIAIVMDGNGRWAKRYFLPRLAGHKKGVDALKGCVQACLVRGVRALTVFAFSSENWNRPSDEVSGLIDILAKALVREVPGLSKNGVQLHFVGSQHGLSSEILLNLRAAESLTSINNKLILNVCFNYGGRWDIVNAVKNLLAQEKEITEPNLEGALSLSHVAHPDLLIRTGGEKRISNFLLWQSAYSELYFSDVLWPDFGDIELDAAIAEYRDRERRFGRISEQLRSVDDVRSEILSSKAV